MNNARPSFFSKPGLAEQPLDSDTFRLDFAVRVRGGGETACEFASSYEIPLGLRPEHLHNTSISHRSLFEHSVEMPIMIAVRIFLEKKCMRFREEQEAAETREASDRVVKDSLPSAPADPFVNFENPLPYPKMPTDEEIAAELRLSPEFPAAPRASANPLGRVLKRTERPLPHPVNPPDSKEVASVA